MRFMKGVFAMDESQGRKLQFLYHQSGIDNRYSVISDYSKPVSEWKFYPASENLEPFPSLEMRMIAYNRHAPSLSVDAIRDCLEGQIPPVAITHLITVSCTGLSAPGLDLQVMELMDLPKHIFRSSVNFMGCYAAIHALKIADSICKSDAAARVVIVCTELCTLHFQKEATSDNIASSLLFGDGSAALLVTHDSFGEGGLHIGSFYAEVIARGKKDMAWELSRTGFLMTLSSYIPDLLEEDFAGFVDRALNIPGKPTTKVDYWCIHPGGKRILTAVARSLNIREQDLQCSYDVMRAYGNMSSPTILFVLKELWEKSKPAKGSTIFNASFGPGLTMETMMLEAV